jgi:hypothetical protein
MNSQLPSSTRARSALAKGQPSGDADWKDTLRTFGQEAFPELLFAVVGAITYALAKLLNVGGALADVIGLVALLVLASEVLLRWSFTRVLHSERDAVRDLSVIVQRFGLAVADHSELDNLARTYVDDKAKALAGLQRELSELKSCAVSMEDLFTELGNLVSCADSTGTEIRAIASQRLEEYIQPGPAQAYFALYTAGRLTVGVRRIFILDAEQLGTANDITGRRAGKRSTGNGVKYRPLRELIRNQELEFAKRDPGSGYDHVRWLYRKSDDGDTRHNGHSVDPTFAIDWILFGREILVEHEKPGEGVARITIRDDEIERQQRIFDELWTRGLPVADLPEELPSRPATPKRVRLRESREVGSVGQIVESRDEVA